ncbi:DNA cytosine methyltransferase [Hymenobacter perfusus]|uniref:Cytosine-specific methyltransferase n=1 Tax=Hymenobacter perfusus TaxID=1236770 RepID=A0A428JXV9_9BACT|nr:DNA cytosine methyltransferase [Hymenobacter perfusus]RSK38976.1 DNA cytosine methyltransferase [Hymenobacter perfusus]
MPYLERINELLHPAAQFDYHAVDLFAGCGGLSLGFESVGIDTTGFEMDPYAVQTYNANLHGRCHQRKLTPEVDFLDLVTQHTDLVIGGPPCQPFSVGGLQMGLEDARDGFPIFINTVAALQPRMFLFENVRGMLYTNKWYLNQIVTELRGLGYIVEAKLFNVVNYGIPQNRERVIVVGHRGGFQYPQPQRHKVTAGEAVGDTMNLLLDESKLLTESQDRYVKKYEIASKCVNPRDLYADRPSRTVTCRNLAAATGDMHRVRLPDGRRRRLVVREGARIQSFPDNFDFKGPEAKQFYQIGNAVPPLFAYQLAQSVRNVLDAPDMYTAEQIREMADQFVGNPALF